MSNGPGLTPIYTGGGIPIKGFDTLIEVAAQTAQLDARRRQQLQNARRGQVNKIQTILDDVYQETGADLAPALRPFWSEYVDGVDQQIQNMTLKDGEPITSVSQGLALLNEANSFYDHLYNYNHFEGKYAPEDEIGLIENLISDPVARRKFKEKAPVNKNYQLDDATKANSRLAQMQNFADIGFIGASAQEILDGSYAQGGYAKYAQIDYSGQTPRLKLTQPNGVVDRNSASGYASPGSYLDGLSIYGANHQGLFNVERFAVEREAKTLEALGQEYLQPQVKADRVQLGWDRGTANNLAPGLIRDTTEVGQNIRYGFLKVVKKDNPNIFSEAEERAFLFNNPQLAFDLDPQGNVIASEQDLTRLRETFDRLIANPDYNKAFVNGSKYDRAIQTDATEERQSDAFRDMLAGMTRLNPNDVFSMEQIEELIDQGLLLNDTDQYGRPSYEAYHMGYARLLAESEAVLGQQIQPGSALDNILIAKAPSFALVGQALDEQAGVTREFVESFGQGKGSLPQTLGRFPINASGSTELQFSPEDGIEGNIDTVYFMENPVTGMLSIGVALNKSGVTSFGKGTRNLPIVPLAGQVTFTTDTPLFDVVTDAEGAQSLRDLGRVQDGIGLQGRTFKTGTPENVFYFDPNDRADISRLATLGSKLDKLYGKSGEQYPNAVLPDLGYVLNSQFDASNR